ncbi:nicotinate-nucleotide--dimethylbenzimidazole phosphoribosyltransferase [Streptacidiphilus melanogenes]|uniref:nicotinate-nucleotide--dimethylbenzimidazole phosphoribosyltransferase n=1 Tax=Streptacidiphilus melanogenes TaxID=411235 RepID=UPI0005AA63AC|nr:nicotinate-nucleotide--dimethylbenzimidazole phosphoribosyltransferase [Streptacidiphilus melanogenes]
MSETGNVPPGGQVPGLEPEQVPQHVGYAAEQGPVQGVRPAYTFLDDVDEEEDELLMPGPQGAWNETARGQEYPQAQNLPPVVSVVPGQPGGTGAEMPGILGSYEPGVQMHAPAHGEPPAPSWPPMAPPGAEAPHAAVAQPHAPVAIDPLTDPLSSVLGQAAQAGQHVPGVHPGMPVEAPAGDPYVAQGYTTDPYLAAAGMPGLPVETFAPAEQAGPTELAEQSGQAVPAAEAAAPAVEPVPSPQADELSAADGADAQAQQTAPRRPLHAGPPIPDPSLMTGQVPVRSLADRGPSSHGGNGSLPAGTPPYGVTTSNGPTTLGGAPEYLDQSASAVQAAAAGTTVTVTATVPMQMPSPDSTLGGSAAQVETALQNGSAVPAEPAVEQVVEQAEPAAPTASGPFVMEPVPAEPIAVEPVSVEPIAVEPTEPVAEPEPEPSAESSVASEPVVPAERGAVEGAPMRIASFIAPPSQSHSPVQPEETAQGIGVLTGQPLVEPVAVDPAAEAEQPVAEQPDQVAAEASASAESVSETDPQTPAQSVSEPVDEPASEPSAEAPADVAAEPVAEPVAESVDRPVGEQGAVSGAQPGTEAPGKSDVVEAEIVAEQAVEQVPETQEAQSVQEPPQAVAAEPTIPHQTSEAVVPAAGDEPAPAAPGADTAETETAEPQAEAELETEFEELGDAAPGYDEDMREAVHRVMRERRDIRNGFRSDPIPHEVLIRVLEAAHTAPSVGYSQPWDFVVIRSAKTRTKMHELAERQRDIYAESLPKGRAKQFKELKIEAIRETPVNIVVTADRTRGGRHTLGRHTQPQMAPYSAALAVENLWLAARAEGLGVGWVSFFDEEELVRELGLPEHLEVVAYLCVGYVNEFPDEPELAQAGWAKKRPLSWVVHEETYGRRALPGEEPHSVLQETLRGIRPLDAKALGEAWDRQKRMTKPAGSLGMLEIISAQLCGLSRKCPPPIPEPACVAIFAGDHGVHAQGVTPWPQEVTAQMVGNFLAGGAVINAFASQLGAEVCVVDVGVASELPPALDSGRTTGLLPRKVRPGTGDMTQGPAMTREEAMRALEVGIETARDLVAAGNKALVTGDMGIANTTAAAALISVFTGEDPAAVTGRGTGIDDETHARKVAVIRQALELHRPDPSDPIGVLAAVGGLEHAAIAGFLLGAASLRTPVILDGVIAGSAALVAKAIAPEVLAACVAGHRSAEPGHKAALAKLGLRPLIDLDLRLGEGTGALLALPLVQSAARAMHDVATFDSAGVTEKH